MLFFRWIRDSVRNAVLGGVQDALEHMNKIALRHESPDVDIDPEVVETIKVDVDGDLLTKIRVGLDDNLAKIRKEVDAKQKTAAPKRAKK